METKIHTSLRTVEWKNNVVVMIDQTKLPNELVYVNFTDYRNVADAIRNLVVRGAPAIGVSAAFGLALAALQSKAKTTEDLLSDLEQARKILHETRPMVGAGWKTGDARRGPRTHVGPSRPRCGPTVRRTAPPSRGGDRRAHRDSFVMAESKQRLPSARAKHRLAQLADCRLRHGHNSLYDREKICQCLSRARFCLYESICVFIHQLREKRS